MAKKTKDSNLSIEEKSEQALIPNWDEPYKLPDNWCWVKLSTVCSLENGEKITGEELVYLDAKTLRGITEPQLRNSGVIVNKDQKVILVDGENSGEVFVVPRRGYMGSTFKIISISDKVNEMYIRYFIEQNRDKLRNNKIGSAIPHLNKELFFGLELPLPPLSEQVRVVEHIESLFCKLDEAKEKAQEVVDGFETRKATILHKAFSGELTEKWRMIHSDQIGEIDTTPLDKNIDNYDVPYTLPKSWRWVRFNECCTFVGSGITPKGGKEVYQSQGVPFIRSQNVLKGVLDLSDVAYISPEIDDLMKRTRILGGETLFNITGASIGRSCFVPVSQTIGNVNQHVCIIRYRNYIKPELPQFWLNSPYMQRFVVENQVGQTRQALNFKQIRGMYYPLAPIAEQTEMVHILENLLAKEQQAKESAEAVIEQIHIMKKAILVRAFRGELGTNDPSDESGVELLKKVLGGCVVTQVSTKKSAKRILIPSDIKELLSNIREEEIIKLLLKSAPQPVSLQGIMSLSSKKFELMDALRTLEKKQLITKNESSEYSLTR